MTADSVTAPERLRLLLPFLNGDLEDANEDLARFLWATMGAWGADDGSEFFGWRAEPPGPLAPQELTDLREVLVSIVEEAGAPGEKASRPAFRLPSLRFGISRKRARPAKLPRTAAARRAATGPGAFRFCVSGSIRDAVIYAFMRTLSEPGAVHLSRCPAPAAGDWSRTCGHYVIRGRRRGRPQEYCSDRCRVRAHRVKRR